MAKHIVTATPRTLAEFLEQDALPVIGRPARSLQASDLGPAINQNPQTFTERRLRVIKLRANDFTVPADEYMEFPELDYSGDYETPDSYEAFAAINWS
jgi:hypothetical protein